MPIGSGIVYNTGDLILSQVSSSGTAFLETKIASATSSLIYFDSTARINSASLNSITVGTASYVSGSTSIITNLTASNISASGTGSFGIVGIGTVNPSYKLHIVGNVYGTTTGQFGNAVITGTGTGYAVYGSNAGATGVKINLDSDITRNDLVISASTGYVGIGTTSPTARLHVSGSTGGVFEVDTVGGATTLYVTASGNVGIGTIIPIAKLQVAGAGIFASELLHSSSDQIGWVNAKFTDYNDGHGIYISSLQAGGGKWLSGEGRYWNSGFWRSTSTTSTAISLDSGALKFYTNTGLTANSDFQPSERMRINSAGNVGIGTTNPAYLLDVSGSSRHGYRTSDAHYFTGSVSISGSLNATASWATNALTASFLPVGTYNITSSWANNVVTASYLVPTNSYTITNLTASNISASGTSSFGYVGIGTTGPAQKLDVRGYVVSDVGSNAVEGGFYLGNGSHGLRRPGGSSNDVYLYTTSGTLYMGASGNSSQHLTILTGGNVGIGTTSPSALLHVYNGSSHFEATSTGAAVLSSGVYALQIAPLHNRITTAGTYYGGIAFNHLLNFNGGTTYNGAPQAWIGTRLQDTTGSERDYLVFATKPGTGTSGAGNDIPIERMCIDRDGLVGIGTTSPSYLLDVSGSSRHGYRSADNHFFTGSVNISGSLNATASWATNALTASFLPVGTYNITASWANNVVSASYLVPTNSYTITNLTASNISASSTGSFGIVGIGTTSPAYKLDVAGSIYGYNYFTLLTAATYGPSDNSAAMQVFGSTGSGGLTNTIKFVTGGSERWRITDAGILQSPAGQTIQTSTGNLTLATAGGNGHILLSPNGSGNVGIGTTSPNQKLSIYPGTTGGIALQDSGGTTRSYFFIDNTNPIYSTGIRTENYYLDFDSSGGAQNAIRFYTGTSTIGTGTERMRITSGGNVGIGTTNPAYLLDVSGSSRHGYRTSDAHYFTGSVNISGSLNATASWANNVVSASYATTAQTANALNVSNTYTVAGLTSGNVNVTGTTIPSTGIYRPASKTLGLSADTTLILKIDGTGAPYVTSIESGNFLVSGDVGIGTAAPAAKLEISGSSNSALLNIKSPISGAILYVSGSGAVGIGTTAVGAFTLQVSGSFGATTKSFIIDHPTKAGKKLMYGSLESPYHGIRLTGRDTLVNGKCKIQLPDYMYKLILHDSVNIQLTGIKCNKTLYIDDINIPENYFTIAYDKAIFESYKDYDFFWDFTAIRADVPELQTEM